MEIFIKFLIREINTFDSNKNSFNFLHDAGFINRNLNSKLLMNHIYNGYRIIKIRMKIGYHMSICHQTFEEYWLNAILKAYLEREAAGLIPNAYPKPQYKLIDELHELDIVKFYYKANDEVHQDDKHKVISRQMT